MFYLILVYSFQMDRSNGLFNVLQKQKSIIYPSKIAVRYGDLSDIFRFSPITKKDKSVYYSFLFLIYSVASHF